MALAPLVFLPPSRLATSATDSHFWSGQKQDCYAIRAIDPRPEGRGFPHAGLHNLAIIAAQDVLAEQALDAATPTPNLTHATHFAFVSAAVTGRPSIDRQDWAGLVCWNCWADQQTTARQARTAT